MDFKHSLNCGMGKNELDKCWLIQTCMCHLSGECRRGGATVDYKQVYCSWTLVYDKEERVQVEVHVCEPVHVISNY